MLCPSRPDRTVNLAIGARRPYLFIRRRYRRTYGRLDLMGLLERIRRGLMGNGKRK